MKFFFALLLSIWSVAAMGLISSPLPLVEGDRILEIRSTREGGTMKPSQNRNSFQSANNLLGVVNYAWAPTDPTLSDLFYRIEYRYIQTPAEQVAGQIFHPSNTGHQLTLGSGFSIFHIPDASLNFYGNLSPLIDINRNKFALPRVDLLQLGLRGGFNIQDNYFAESILHWGSGIPNEQNMYVFSSFAIGRRMSKSVLKFGSYAETDLEERKDAGYNSVFNSNAYSETIRLYKVGVLAEFGYRFTDKSSISISYLQKFFGQYLSATNAASIAYSLKL